MSIANNASLKISRSYFFTKNFPKRFIIINRIIILYIWNILIIYKFCTVISYNNKSKRGFRKFSMKQLIKIKSFDFGAIIIPNEINFFEGIIGRYYLFPGQVYEIVILS